MLRDVLADNWRGVPLLLLAILFYTFGINAIETFFSLYGRSVLRISEDRALMILGLFFIAYIVASVPAGMVGERFGRRQTMTAGLLVISAAGICRVLPAVAAGHARCHAAGRGRPGPWSTPTPCRSCWPCPPPATRPAP